MVLESATCCRYYGLLYAVSGTTVARSEAPFSLQCRGDEVGGSVLVEQAAGNGIHVEI